MNRVSPRARQHPAPNLFERIEEAVSVAQDLAISRPNGHNEVRVRDELIPSLYQARTYIEVGRFADPEVRGGLSSALSVAYRLADEDRAYNRLVNRLRVLLEDAELLARPK